MKPSGDAYSRAFLAVLAVLTLVRAWFAAATDLSPDEAYYWAWSTSLAPGYFDHGPLVAWMIRIGTLLAGKTELGVRLGGLLCSCLTAIMVFRITRKLTGSSRQAFWTFLALSVCPLFSVGAVVHTPDAALAASWSLAVWFALRVYHSDKLGNWLGLGICTGMAILAKLTGAFLLAGLGLYLVSCKSGRERLKRPGPAVAALVAMGVALPNLVWNGAHDGGSFVFQLRHATEGLEVSGSSLVSFLGGQAGVISPLLWLGLVLFMLIGWRRSIRFGRAEVFLLWCLSAPLLLAFLLLSLFHKIEANWPAVVYLAALPGATWAWTGGQWYLRHMRVWFGMSVGLAAVLTLLIHLQTLVPFLPVDPHRDPTRKLRGWSELAREAETEALALYAVLGSEGYGPVSELKFYTEIPVVYERSSTRRSQYDLWNEEIKATRVLFLQPVTTSDPPRICTSARERWLLIKPAGEHGGVRAGDFRWWVCEGLEGGT